MGNYALQTTADQDQVIAYRLGVVNAERAAQVPPQDPLDVEGLIHQYLDSVVNQYSEAALGVRRGRLIDLYESASDTDRATIDSVLGLGS